MYIPKHFEISDAEQIFQFVEENAFAQVVSTVEGKLFSTYMPMLISEDHSSLFGHFALQNPQWRDIDEQEVLVSIQGPHDYISPSWYQELGVPTWNYQAVQISGIARVFRDESRLKVLVDSLTEKYESALEEPWQPNYSLGMLKGIVGFEIEISNIQCKFKLNQNRSLADQQKVAIELEKKGAHQLAKAMREQMSKNRSL